MELRILIQNLCQCLPFLGDDEQGISHYRDFTPSLPIELFSSLSPDVCFFSEILINDKNEITQNLSEQLGLKYFETHIVEDCWIENLKGLKYGLSFLSKFPIVSYDIVKFPNPNLTYKQADGSLFKTHDKYAQLIKIKLPNGVVISSVNLHSFPFHRFNESISSPNLTEWRQNFERSLNITNKNFLLAGDFNNKNFGIQELLPNSFSEGLIYNAINFQEAAFEVSFVRPNQIDGKTINGPEKKYASPSNQIDYLLLSPDLSVIERRVIITESDHPLLFSTIETNS